MKVRGIFVCFSFLVMLGCTTSQVRTAEVPNLKLSFIVDKAYDEHNIIWIFRHDDPAGLEGRAASMGFDSDLARRIREAANPSEVADLVGKLVDDRFRHDGAAIEAAKEDLAVQWKDLLPSFSNVVMETTESPWVHPEYVCVVSSYFAGLSDWSGNKVAVRFDYGPEYKRRILAHEIVLSDVFQLLRKRYSSAEIGDWQVWAFSEITAVLILDDPRLQAFWPSVPQDGVISGYRQLAGPKKQLKELFDHRTSYRDYEEKSVSVLKDFQPFVLKSGWLGVFFHDIQVVDSSPQFIADMHLTDTKGAFILGVYRGSPADRAGLMVGDCITAVGSTRIESAGQLTQAVGSLAAGTKTDMTVLRLGEEKVLSVTIGERGLNDTVAQPRDLWPGFTVTGSSGSMRGVVVASISSEKSPAGVAGLKMGDLITAVNGITIESSADFYRAINVNGGRAAIISIARDGNEITLRL